MSFNIVVPDLGESVVEATIARWLKHEGDPVSVGEAVLVLETEKVDLEVGAEKEGVLSKIQQPDGADVKIGEILGVIDETGAKSAPAEKPAAPAKVSTPAPVEAPVETAKSGATPVAKRVASEKEVDLAQVEPSKPGARVTKSDVERFAETKQTPAPAHPLAPSAPPERKTRRFRRQHRMGAARNGSSSHAAAAPLPSGWSKHSTTPPC